MTRQNTHRAARHATVNAVDLRRRRTWHVDADKVSEAAPWVSRPTPSTTVDDATVTYLQRPAQDAVKQAQQILSDKRFSDAHKRQEIDALFAEAREKVEQRAADELTATAEKRVKLTATARVPLSPKADEAHALLYVRDVLQVRVKQLGDMEIRALWDDALQGGDLLTARVLSDFLPAWKWRRRGTGGTEELASPPGWYAEKKSATEDAMRTPEQRKAHADLAKLPTEIDLNIAKSQALMLIQAGWSVDRDGTLVNGALTAQTRRLRSGW